MQRINTGIAPLVTADGGMGPKKRHEVGRLAGLVRRVTQDTGATAVLDVGAGLVSCGVVSCGVVSCGACELRGS